jgi:hypothetical protein
LDVGDWVSIKRNQRDTDPEWGRGHVRPIRRDTHTQTKKPSGVTLNAKQTGRVNKSGER